MFAVKKFYLLQAVLQLVAVLQAAAYIFKSSFSFQQESQVTILFLFQVSLPEISYVSLKTSVAPRYLLFNSRNLNFFPFYPLHTLIVEKINNKQIDLSSICVLI